jgi:hypothetical protein
MTKTIISELSDNLSKEISERKIYDLEEISNLIKVRVSFGMRDLIREHSTNEEVEYMKLLREQSKNRIGSNQYISTGYKLAEAKQKKSSANRAANNMGREDNYLKLQNFIRSKSLDDLLIEFHNTKP